MNRFLPEDPITQRVYLIAGLLFCLGSTLSWNPENTQIARNEFSQSRQIELASEAPESLKRQRLILHRLAVKEFAPRLCGTSNRPVTLTI